MKKIYLITTSLVFILFTNVNAQVQVGVSVGLTNSRLNGEAVGVIRDLTGISNGRIVTQPRNSIYAGAYIDMPLTDRLSLQPGIYYSQKGYSIKGDLGIKNLDF